MRVLLLCVVLGFGAQLMVGAPVFAQERPRAVSLDEGRALAERLTSMGQPRAAREMALGLLRADPRDVRALVALARAELALGRIEQAQQAATAALSAANETPDRFIAALVVAEIFAREQQFARSQLWLRRAQNHAQSDAEQRIVAQAYSRVRTLNPLSVQLSLGLTPSNNVNSGNSNQTITFAYLPGPFATIPWAVPEDDKPLTGFELSGDVALRYRLSQTDTSKLSLDGGVAFKTYVMSNEARTAAPAVTGRSLSFGMANVGLSYQAVPVPDGPAYSAQLQYSYAIYAMDPYSHALSLSLGTRWAAGPRDTLAITANLRHTYYISNKDTVTAYEVQGQWDRALAHDRSITTSLKLARTEADKSDRAYTGAAASVSYDFGRMMDRFDLSALYQQEFRVYDTSGYDPAGREDRQTVLQLRVGFPDVQIYGFDPIATLTARRMDSSVPFFDTEGVQIGLNFRSSF